VLAVRTRCLLTAACFVASAVVLAARAPGGGGPSGTLYPWWTWLVVIAGTAGALAPLLVAHRPRLVAAAPALTGVLALHLAGTGVVAWKHWRPVSGMAGIGIGHLPALEAAALAMAAAGLLAAALSAMPLLRQLGRTGEGGWRARCALAGVAVLLLVPAGLGLADAELRDLTSAGAIGLIYAGPWAAGLLAAAVLPRPAAQGAVLGVALTAALAAVGPQMLDLLPSGPASVVFASVLVVALLVAPREPHSTSAPAAESRVG